MCARAGDVTDPNDELEKVPTIALSKLDVDDTNLELSYKIRNDTDHDVWICNNVNVYGMFDFEVFMSDQEQSLLIRRRLDVPSIVDYWFSHPTGHYVLLRSGQELIESVSLAIPVASRRLFAREPATSDNARRLVVEIGFYNEDLPKLIRNILEIAEKLNCAHIEFSKNEIALVARYFKGIWITLAFGGLSRFDEHVYKEGNEDIEIPYTWQNLGGEQVLRIELDGVHIPYDEVN